MQIVFVEQRLWLFNIYCFRRGSTAWLVFDTIQTPFGKNPQFWNIKNLILISISLPLAFSSIFSPLLTSCCGLQHHPHLSSFPTLWYREKTLGLPKKIFLHVTESRNSQFVRLFSSVYHHALQKLWKIITQIIMTRTITPKRRVPFVLEIKILELLLLHSLHQSLEHLHLQLKMFSRQNVLLFHLPRYHVCPLDRLLADQASNLQ